MNTNGQGFRRHIFYVLVENRSGVLARVAGLFSARGFNIESLSVAPTDNPRVSRMTIVCPGDDKILDQVRKQLAKLIDVHEVRDFSVEDRDIVDRELVLCKIKVEPRQRSEVAEIANIFRAHIADVSPESLIVEATGSEGKIKALLSLLAPYHILEVARGGRVAMARSLTPDPVGVRQSVSSVA
ncbi:MAG TPA: acetolactate synthase small subunit [bacterium]|nr:acetolactate synthase small subunit [bacterium]HPO98963.1 acetolactate synthase small subunit [bacterium]